MINKRKFSIQNTKKVLHKHGKQWIVISAALLMMLGIGSVSTKVSHADNINHNQINTVRVAPNNNQQQPNTVANRAQHLHSQILNNAGQKSAVQNQSSAQSSQALVPASSVIQNNYVLGQQNAAPKNTAGTTTAPTVTTYGGVSSQQKMQRLQQLYTLFTDLMNMLNDSDGSTPAASDNNVVQPSDNPSNNVPSDNASDNNQPSDNSDVTGNYAGLNYKYNQANNSVEFTDGTCTLNGGNSLLSSDADNNLSGVTSAKIDSDCDFSGMNNMSYLFSNDHNLQSLSLPSSFDSSNVSDMNHMFANDSDLQSLTLPNLDTSIVNNMSDMFGSDSSLQSLTLPDSFNTSDVSDMSDMFNSDSDLQSLTLPDSFDTSNVTNMNAMFGGDNNLSSSDIPSDIPNSDLPSDDQSNDNTPSDNSSSDNQPSDNTPSNNVPSDNQSNNTSNSDSSIQNTLQQMKDRVFSDINNDRAQNNEPALQMNSDMNEIADQRAQQLESKFSHYDSDGNTYYTEDASSDGINLSDEPSTGENIGMQWFSSVPTSSDLGDQIADGTDHGMMYNDASSNWGHRKNILSSDYGVVGIGASYDGNGNFYISEDFAANPPSDGSAD